MTNGDRIRNMDDQELAEKMHLTCSECIYDPFVKDGLTCVRLGYDCTYGKRLWLEKEAINGQ